MSVHSRGLWLVGAIGVIGVVGCGAQAPESRHAPAGAPEQTEAVDESFRWEEEAQNIPDGGGEVDELAMLEAELYRYEDQLAQRGVAIGSFAVAQREKTAGGDLGAASNLNRRTVTSEPTATPTDDEDSGRYDVAKPSSKSNDYSRESGKASRPAKREKKKSKKKGGKLGKKKSGGGSGGVRPYGDTPKFAEPPPANEDDRKFDNKPKEAQDGFYKDGDTVRDSCEEVCEIAGAICEIETRICDMADRHAGDQRYENACERASEDCRVASEACRDCTRG